MAVSSAIPLPIIQIIASLPCTRSLIQAGVSEVVYPKDLEIPERWQKDFDIASQMMKEAGIIVRTA